MNFKEMASLKIKEQRAAIRYFESIKSNRELTLSEKLSLEYHSEIVINLENVLGNMEWLDKYS